MTIPAGKSRRSFLSTAGLAAAGVTIVPRHVLGRGFTAPSDRLNIAAVGVGGRGRAVITNMVGENLVALCDVDWDYADQGFADLETDIAKLEERIAAGVVEVRVPASARNEGASPVTTRPMTPLERSRAVGYAGRQRQLVATVPKATRHQDFRRMLEQQKDIEAVVVATPDHLHAPVALAAMDLGKHVYVEKPLCWSVAEARQLARRAAETKVVTQMGNQGHSTDDGRLVVEYLQAGALGAVTEVHVWTNRPLGFWPQGVPRPATTARPVDVDGMRWNGPGITARLGAAMGHYPKPEGLAWDLFLGPAPYVEYHPVYHPFNWRGWVDWGAGPLGDMGAHLIDHAYWGLDLGLPTTVETVSTPFNNVSFPHATMTFYEFAARGRQPAVRMTWYDGGLLPPKPAELTDEDFNPGGGALIVGTKGKLIYENYGAKPCLLPKALHASVGTPARTLARVDDENHELNWVEAAKGHVPASSSFDYAAKLTEVMLLGIVSLRAGKKLHYDAANMRVTNDESANEFLSRVPRQY